MVGRGVCIAGGGVHGGGGASVLGVMHGRGCTWWGACMVGGMHGGGRRGMHGRSGGMCGRGACMVGLGACVGGGMHGRGVWQGTCIVRGMHGGGMCGRGCAWQGGGCVAGGCMCGGGCAWHAHSPS